MVFIDLIHGQLSLKQKSRVSGDVPGIISLTFEIHGCPATACTINLLQDLTRTRPGEAINNISDGVKYVVAEITDLIYDNARYVFQREGLNLSAAIPACRENHTITSPVKETYIGFSFEAASGKATVGFYLEN